MADRRERILSAARAELAIHGFDADINDVLRRAGVGAGTVYRHFANKEALFREVAAEVVDRTRAEFIRIASEHQDARECVARTIELGFQNVREYGSLAVQLFHGSHSSRYDDFFEREALEAFFAALIRRGIDQGHFRADLDVEHAVGVWFALVAPPVLARMTRDRTLEEVAASTSAFLLGGLAPRSAPA